MIELELCARIRIGSDTENANATAIAIYTCDRVVCAVGKSVSKSKCLPKQIHNSVASYQSS